MTWRTGQRSNPFPCRSRRFVSSYEEAQQEEAHHVSQGNLILRYATRRGDHGLSDAWRRRPRGGGHGGGGYHSGTHVGGYGGTRYGTYHNYGDFRYGSRYRGYGYAYPYYGGVYPYYGYSDLSNGILAPYAADVPLATAPPTGDYPSATVIAPSDTHAYVTVKAPVDARIWIQNSLMTSGGAVREFV